MTPLRIFRRKEKEEKEVEKKAKEAPIPARKTLLEDLCKGDTELYNALSRTLLLNPEMTKNAGEIDARAGKAQEYENNKDFVKARIEFQVAGELALYEGKTAQVQKWFKKAAEVDPAYPNKNVFDYLAKKENADKAITVAQEYYAHSAKPSQSV